MIDEKLLRESKKKKAKKPKFRRQESWRYKRVKTSWRRPRGIDSRMRQKKKGLPKSVNIGYKGPKKTRHLHPLGYKEVLIHNQNELVMINPDEEIARIAHTVGARKRSQIIDYAENLGVIIVNPIVPLELAELAETERLEDVELEDFELDLEEEF
jgi:large subunit ribosomal protein L32e